ISDLLPQVFEPLANLVRGPKEMRLDRSGIEAGDSGDFRNRKLFEMLENENRALSRRQSVHRRREPLPNLTRHRAAFRRGVRMRGDIAGARFVLPAGRRLVKVEDEAAPLQSVFAPVDADSRQPGLEGRAFAKVVQVLIRLEETFLRRAVGLPNIAQEAVGDASDPPVVPADEVLEGLRMAGANLLDQAALIDAGIGLARNHRESRHIR